MKIKCKKGTIIFICIWIFSAYEGYGCTCIGSSTVKSEFKESDVVVVGTLLENRLLTIRDSLMPAGWKTERMQYTFRISTIYKGKKLDDTIVITSGLGKGDCGFVFSLGEEYILYCNYMDRYYRTGDKVKKFLYTDICTRTRSAKDHDELKELANWRKRKKWLFF